MIHVVSGLVVRSGRVLMTQRLANKSHPFTWETPGGKVDACEDPVNALARELREEVGIGARGKR